MHILTTLNISAGRTVIVPLFTNESLNKICNLKSKINIMLVQHIMTNHIVALDYSMPFLDAAKMLIAYHISGAPVVTESGELIGIISEKDLMRAMYPTYRQVYEHSYLFYYDEELEAAAESAKEKTVAEIMSKRLITTTPDTHVLKVGGLMIATGVHRVPVIDENHRLIGMVSRGDVYRAMLEEKFGLDLDVNFKKKAMTDKRLRALSHVLV